MKTISRYIMTLALLLTAAMGAWAEEEYESFDLSSANTNVNGTHFTITGTSGMNNYGLFLSGESVTVTSLNGENITRVEFIIGLGKSKAENITGTPGTNSCTNGNENGSITDINATSVTLSTENTGTTSVSIKQITVYYGNSEPSIEVTPVAEPAANTKQWTFKMPGSDVVLTPIYAKAAAFATTGTEPEVKTLLPEAAEGVIAGTDASLIAEGTGIVAFAGTSTEVTQGTLMYAIGTSATEAPALTAFSATVPTAENVNEDGAEVLVWYYIQGADATDGEDATLDNTFNNTEPACLTVSVRSNKFDLTLKAANANTIDATQASKGSVSVKEGDAAAVNKTGDITNGKLEAIKMGSEVKLSTKQGYKFRKVEVKKTGSAVLAPALENGATVVIICNWGYATTTFTYTNNGGTFSGQASGYEAEYFNNGLELNGKNLSFSASNVDNSEYLSVGITFNTESSAYSYTGKGQDFVSFTISVNGTDVTDQLTEVK